MSNIFERTKAKYYKHISQCIGIVNAPPILTFDDISVNDLEFVPNFKCKPGLHLGQRKLFLSELQYLTNIWKNLNPDETHYVVYAGAAPSNKTHFLATFFPNIKFILVDPAKFELFIGEFRSWEMLRNSEFRGFKMLRSKYNKEVPDIPKEEWLEYILHSNVQIYIIEDYFTDEMAHMFAPLRPIFFSDIRSKDEEADAPTDVDFLWNSAMQLNWINIMKPAGYMLKFRMPFFEARELYVKDFQKEAFASAKKLGIDFIANYYARKYQYLDGTIFLQAFPGNASSESRLCHYGPVLKYTYYNVNAYENAYFYYNTVARFFIHHRNPYADSSIGFDHCNDCSIEAAIWENYSKIVFKLDPRNCAISLSGLLKKSPLMQKHGKFMFPSSQYIIENISYNHIDLNKIKFVAPPKMKIKYDTRYKYTLPQIRENIQIRIPTALLPRFNALMDAAFKESKLKRSYADLKEKFPFVFWLRSFKPIKSCLYERGTMDILIRFICEACPSKLIIIGTLVHFKYLMALVELTKIPILYFGEEGEDYNENISTDEPKMYNFKQKNNILEYSFLTKIKNAGLLLFSLPGSRIKRYAEDIVNISCIHYSLIKMIKPAAWCIRFNPLVDRNPIECAYISEYKSNIDIAKKLGYDIMSGIKNESFTYLDGDMWILPYNGEKSFNGYLYGAGNKLKIWDLIEFREKMMYFTQFDRIFYWHENKYVNKIDGYDCCNDCALDSYILQMYCRKYNKPFSYIYQYLKNKFDFSLFTKGHGYMFEKNKNILVQMFEHEPVSAILMRQFGHI